MNLPNKLTLIRMIATPIFMFLMVANFPGHYIAALVVFILASITDALDGNIARKQNLVTNFGKFLDPLADKMLTTSAFLGFLAKGVCPGITWIVFIVLFREFAITSLRLVCVGSGKVIAANIWGKAKTVSQMLSIIVTIFFMALNDLITFSGGFRIFVIITVTALLWICAILTVISGVIYLKENKEAIDPTK